MNKINTCVNFITEECGGIKPSHVLLLCDVEGQKKIREETNNKKRKKKHKENKDGMCVSNDGSSICTCEMPFSFFLRQR
jgi:hypothetical protein